MNDDTIPQIPTTSVLSRIFVGPQGIRAGWSIGIFFICFGLLEAMFFFPTKYLLDKFNLPIDDAAPIQTCMVEFTSFLALLGASMVMALIEHRPLVSYGLEGTQRVKKFLFGFLSGVLALSVLVGALNLFGFLVFDGQAIYGWEAIQYALGWLAAFFMVGLLEEYLVRGYMQATLTRGVGFWWSATVLSIAFGCIHIMNPGETPVGIGAAAIVGFVFCISLWYLKNLWWAIGFHGAWDWSESYLWGTADSGRVAQGHLFSVHPQGNILWSGGSTGPEGSLLILPLLLIIALLMRVVWKNVAKKEMTDVTDAIQ